MKAIIQCTCIGVKTPSKEGAKAQYKMLATDDNIVKCLTEKVTPTDVTYFDFWHNDATLFECGNIATCVVDILQYGDNQVIKFVSRERLIR